MNQTQPAPGPSVETLSRMKKDLAVVASEDLARKRANAAAARKRYEPYREALVKMFAHYGVAPSGSSAPPRPPVLRDTPPRKVLVPQTRLKKNSTGPLGYLDWPTPQSPFAIWDWTQAEDVASGNYAQSSVGQVDPAGGLIPLGIWSGGGTATGWGYVGQYYNGATLLQNWNNAQLSITLSGQTTGFYGWKLIDQNYVTLYVAASVLYVEYDPSWQNALKWQHGPDVPLINVHPTTSYWGITAEADDNGVSIPIDKTFSVSAGPWSFVSENNYGVILQLYYQAEASGGSWAWTSNLATNLAYISLTGTGYT